MVVKITSVLIFFLLIAVNSVLQTAKNLTLLLLLSELVGFLLWPIILMCGIFIGFPYMFSFSVCLILMGAVELVLVSTALIKTT